jgi:hypothetical protein
MGGAIGGGAIGGGAAIGRTGGGGAGPGAVLGGRGGAGAYGSTTNSPCGMSGKPSPIILVSPPGAGVVAGARAPGIEGSLLSPRRAHCDCVTPVSIRFSVALKTSEQRPQRTQPADTRS